MILAEWDTDHIDVSHARTVEEALAIFNDILLQRARLLNIPVGPISIQGISGGSDSEKIAAIRSQFIGLMERLTEQQGLLTG
jgi:hypothetical protein